jgi:nucleotide-binding universal stress UspA family protein
VNVIVVGTDGSETSTAAVAEAIDLGRRLDDALVFVSVAEPVSDAFGDPLWQQKVTKSLRRARRALARAREQAERAGVRAEYELLEGRPAETLVELAQSRNADLIVVGTRGLAGLVGSLLGSVSTAVIRRATRPVVVVRHPSQRSVEARARSRTSRTATASAGSTGAGAPSRSAAATPS